MIRREECRTTHRRPSRKPRPRWSKAPAPEITEPDPPREDAVATQGDHGFDEGAARAEFDPDITLF